MVDDNFYMPLYNGNGFDEFDDRFETSLLLDDALVLDSNSGITWYRIVKIEVKILLVG